MKNKTAAEETAKQLVRKHLTIIAEESMDSRKIILHNAIACATLTAIAVLNTIPIRVLMYDNEKDYQFWTEVMELLATEDYSDITPLEIF